MGRVMTSVSRHLASFRPPSKLEREPLWSKLRRFAKLASELTLTQWGMFLCGWLAWTIDAADFFGVTVTVPYLQVYFNRSTHTVTTAITLTLLFRPLGALIFGLISDRYGRKWPLVVCMYLITALQVGTSYTKTFHAFLACRSLFGIMMGGVWGMAIANALEALPLELRGLASGILEGGYGVGYIIAAVIGMYLIPESSHGWLSLFWVLSGLSAFVGTLRIIIPESPIFLRAKHDREERERLASERGDKLPGTTKLYIDRTIKMFQLHWKLCIWCVFLMTGFNFLAHGSEDLYLTYVVESKGFTVWTASKATIIGSCGGVAGSALAGLISQYLGRRLTMLVGIVWTGAFIPLWIIPTGFSKLAAGAFFVQAGVGAAWGVIPIHLSEMSPPAFRATFPGLMYQLGNMVSSASSQIEATAGDHLTTMLNGVAVPDYGKVQGILMGVVCAFTFIVVLVGPENHSYEFEKYGLAFEDPSDEPVIYADGSEAKGDFPIRHVRSRDSEKVDEKLEKEDDATRV